MKQHAITFVSSVFLCAGSFGNIQEKFYVSPSGNDTNSGTLARPFATLHKARDMVRIIAVNMTGDIVIYLRGGTYELNAPLRFTALDGGTNGHRIIYMAYPCECPVISGGSKITGWTLYDSIKNIYKSKVPTYMNSRQLYVNGARATRARSPDGSGWYPSGDGYNCPAEVATWQNPSHIEVVLAVAYMLHRGPVKSVSPGHITMEVQYWNMLDARDVSPAWIENAYELLDSGGEWYLDNAKGALYYKPRNGEDMTTADIILPHLETLIKGTYVSNMDFRGLTFSYATWLKPNYPTGFRNHGLNVYQDTPDGSILFRKEIPGNVLFDHGSNIRFEDNTFEHLGGVGLQLFTGITGSRVHNNVFRDISASGVAIGSMTVWFPPDEDWVKDDTVDNNLVTWVGVEYKSSSGICIGFTENLQVIHNEISFLPLGGITHGGYGDPSNGGYGGSRSRNNHINYNYLHHYYMFPPLWDYGAIYVIGTSILSPVSTMSHNYIDNFNVPDDPTAWAFMALYMDNYSQGWQADSNVVKIRQLDRRYWLYMQTYQNGSVRHCSADNNYTNSTIVESNGNPVTNTHYFPDANWPPAATAIIKNAGILNAKEVRTQCLNDNSPVIDGINEAVWELIEADTLGNALIDVNHSSSDLQASFKLYWNEDNLFLFANVTDDVLRDDSGDTLHEDDGIDIYFDCNNDKANTYDANDHQFGFRWNDNTVYEYQNGTLESVNPAGIMYAWNDTGEGYNMEISISWSTLGIIAPTAGKLIGFDIRVRDDDGLGYESGMAWSGTCGYPSVSPSGFGTIKLGSSLCGMPTGLPSGETVSGVEIYPNPFSSDFVVKIPDETGICGCVMKFYDILGNEVICIPVVSRKTTVSGTHLPGGIYIFKIQNNNEIVAQGKLISL